MKTIQDFLTNKINLKENDDLYSDEPEITEAQKVFADDVFNMIQDIIDNEPKDDIEEEFTSTNSLIQHFKWHCIGKTNKKSTHSNVLYDFININQYKQYEDKINRKIGLPNNIVINSLYNTNNVIKGFHKFFEGDKVITFLTLCGFQNNQGPVIISFNSYANDVTKNYNQNTVNCIILSLRSKTITLYPIAADKVEDKFNSFVKKYNQNKLPKFSINR